MFGEFIKSYYIPSSLTAMTNPLENFSIVEYISIFSAFIYGYVASRFFSGWGAMINFRRTIKFSKEHLFWTILTFAILIDVWWGSWVKTEYIDDSLMYYLSVMPILIFYMISVTLFPPLADNRFVNLKRYFKSVRKQVYVLYIILFITFELNRVFFYQPLLDMYFNGIGILLCVFGLFSKDYLYHYAILSIGCGILLLHFGSLFAYHESMPEIKGFSLTEYLTIFGAFIYGSVASRFFNAWGSMISHYRNIKINGEYIAWTVLAFALLIDFWIGSWEREYYISWSFSNFMMSLIVPMTYYGLSAVLLPTLRSEGNSLNLTKFYEGHKKIIILFFGITILANGIVANILEQDIMHFENFFRMIALILVYVGYRTSHPQVVRMILFIGWVTFIAKLYVDRVNGI
jgi:hypothetical protein